MDNNKKYIKIVFGEKIPLETYTEESFKAYKCGTDNNKMETYKKALIKQIEEKFEKIPNAWMTERTDFGEVVIAYQYIFIDPQELTRLQDIERKYNELMNQD